MQNNLQALLERNPFALLDIPPSTPAGELRRLVDQARLEVSMGLRQLDDAQFESLSQDLLREPACFEMRLFVPWAGDPALAAIAAAHDRALAELWQPGPVVRVMGYWLVVADVPGIADALAPLLPPNLDLRRLFGEIGAEIVRAATGGAAEPFSLVVVERAFGTRGADPGPVALLAVSASIAEMDALLHDVQERSDGDGALRDPAAGPALRKSKDAFGRVRELQSIATRFPGWDPAEKQASLERLSEKARRSAIAISTALFNGKHFEHAALVDSEALTLQLSPADREELTADLRIVRRGWGFHDLKPALDRKDYTTARHALERIIANTDDSEEREQAEGLLARLPRGGTSAPRATGGSGQGTGPATGYTPQAKPAFAARAISKIWSIAGGFLTLLLIGGVISWLSSLGGDDDDFSSSGVSSASGRLPSDPKVGDCITVSGTTTVSVRVVSCSSRNDGRVTYVGSLTGLSSTPPAQAVMSQRASAICPDTVDSVIYPSSSSWSLGDRTVLCIDE